MTASSIAANVIFSAGWIAVAAAAVYSRRTKAARQEQAKPDAVPPLETRSAPLPSQHTAGAWTNDRLSH